MVLLSCYVPRERGIAMFGLLLGLVVDVAKIAVAPVEIAVDLAPVVTKPLADVAQGAVTLVKEGVEEITHD